METLSLLGSVSTLASSVVELEITAEAEVPVLGSPEGPRPCGPSRNEDSVERTAQSKEKRLNVDQYEEEEFSGIGNIDLEMEQIFADMERIQKKVSEDLDAIVEESSLLSRAADGDDTLMDVFEDTDVEAAGLSLVDISSVIETRDSRPCNSDSSEDGDLRKEPGHLSSQNAEDLEALVLVAETSQSGPVSEDMDLAPAHGTISRGIVCCTQRPLPSDDSNHSCSTDRELLSFNGEDNSKVNGHQVATEPGHLAEVELPATEKMLSMSPTERLEKSNVGKKDILQMENDRLLIEKIKNYYETAEMTNDQFYLQRRESISFIPTGVVRDSILRFNYKMKHESIREIHGDKASGSVPRPCTASHASGPDSRLGHAEAPRPSGRQERGLPAEGTATPLCNGHGNSGESESETEFKSCAEIIKVWREMERAAHFCHEHEPWHGYAKAAKMNKGSAEHPDTGFSEPLLILEDSDLGSSADVASEPVDAGRNPPEEHRGPTASDDAGRGHRYCPGEDVSCGHAPCCVGHERPGIALCEDADSCLFQNSEKIINKVQVLAMMYSQRISRKKAPMQRRLWELAPETRAEPKQRKRRPVIKLARAQEEYQDSDTYDEVELLEPADPYGHLIIQGPTPVLYAQENTVLVSASKGTCDVSSPQLDDGRSGSPPRQPADPPVPSLAGQTARSPPSPGASGPPSLPAASPGSVLQSVTSLLSAFNAGCSSFTRFGFRPPSPPCLAPALPGPALLGVTAGQRPPLSPSPTSSGSQSPTSGPPGSRPLLPGPGAETQTLSSATSSRTQPPGSRCAVAARHTTCPPGVARSAPPSAQADSRARAPAPECSSPPRHDGQAGLEKRLPSPSPPSCADRWPSSACCRPAPEGPLVLITESPNRRIPGSSIAGGAAERASGAGRRAVYPPANPDGVPEPCLAARARAAESAPERSPADQPRTPAGEAPVPRYAGSLSCSSSDLCCSLPAWVSLRGRSPSPSAIRQLEQAMKPPKGGPAPGRVTHTAQPCPSLGPDAKLPQTPSGLAPCAASYRDQERPPSNPNPRADSLPPKRTASTPDSNPPSKGARECGVAHLLSAGLRLRSPSPFRQQNRSPALDCAVPKPHQELPTFTNQRPHSLQLCTATSAYPSASATALCPPPPAPPSPRAQPLPCRGRVNSLPSSSRPETAPAPSSGTGLGLRWLSSSPVGSWAPAAPAALPTEGTCASPFPAVSQRDPSGRASPRARRDSQPNSPARAVATVPASPQWDNTLSWSPPSPLCRNLWPESCPASPTHTSRDRCPSANTQTAGAPTSPCTGTKPSSTAGYPEPPLPSRPCPSPTPQSPAAIPSHEERSSCAAVRRSSVGPPSAAGVAPPASPIPAPGIQSLVRSQSAEAFSPASCSSPRVQSPVSACTVRGIRSPSPERFSSTATAPSPSSSPTGSRVGSPVSLYISICPQSPSWPLTPCPSPRLASPLTSPPTHSPGKWPNGSAPTNQQAGRSNTSCAGLQERSCCPSSGGCAWKSPDGPSCAAGLQSGALTSPETDVPYSAGRKAGLTAEEPEAATWPVAHELRAGYDAAADGEDAGPQSWQKTGPADWPVAGGPAESGAGAGDGGAGKRGRAVSPAGGPESGPSRERGGARASYSTTVNLQIGGGGRLATFSKAQVSLTQTFLPVTGQVLRRVTGGSGTSQAT
uniref:nuclear envelope pore membrane protein POM 121C n=1 Tax=Pristiophorus japonicus TaxID=55135 RepID=UPI00398EB990